MLSNIYFWFAHRFLPKHQYNKIQIVSLDPGYHDPDTRMLYSCFDLFSEWFHYNVFEAELMNRETMDECNPGMYDELMQLYKWWTVMREVEHDEMVEFYEDIEKLHEKDDIMLLRLMKYRRNIWYI